MRRTRTSPLRVLGALVLMLLPTAGVADAESAWSMAPLPGGRAGLLPRVGLAPTVPPALALGEVIRVLHASRDANAAAVHAVREYFSAPPAGAEALPLPLDLRAWQTVLGREVSVDSLIARLLRDRRASLLCYGLLQLDAETLRFLAEDASLLRRLYERDSGILAAFGQALRIERGAIALPGGQAAKPAWLALIGEAVDDPPHGILHLLEADQGRLLYFVDAIARLEPAQRDLVLSERPGDSAGDRLRSVYRAFTNIEPGWRLGDFPFVRLGADPSLLLATFRLGADGQLRHTQAFWSAVLGDRSLSKNHRRRWADIDAGDRVEPAWLLDRLTNAALPQRLEAAQLHAFTERLTDRLASARPADIVYLARAYRRYPALLLSLERLAIDDVDVQLRMVAQASRLASMPIDTVRLEQGLALLQAPLMLVTRAHQARALDDAGARQLVASLSLVSPSDAGYGRAVAAWLRDALLPALGHDAAIEGASPEATLLEALAGLRAPPDAIPASTLVWESSTYRVDVAAPELARLTDVRRLQGGNTLDTALELAHAGETLAASDALAAARAAEARLRRLASALEPLEPSERTTASPPDDIVGIVTTAADELGRVRTRGDARRVPAIAARLSRAEDAVLADVLTSILYALWLGDPQGPAFLAGNVARRHDYGLRLMTGAERQETPWLLPLETSGSGEPWHVRGALLGLDVGLARLALRRTRVDLPDNQPALNESDRRTLLTTLALTNPFELEQEGAERVAAWLRDGRRIARDPGTLKPRLARLSLGGRRREALEWASAHAPGDLPDLLLRTELVLLGRDGDRPLPPAWGQAQTPRTGCLCLAFPDPPAVDAVAGRPGTGLITAEIADLKLHVLEQLHALHLPAALARGVLASALQDYLDDVQPAHGDDWLTLARHLDGVSRDRFDDYVAALTAGGPLVPATPVATSSNGHE